jgi:hypothetical protein
LDVKGSISYFDLAINVFQTQEQPLTNEGIIQQRSFLKQNANYTLNHNDKDIELKRPVSFQIPIKENKVCFFNNGAINILPRILSQLSIMERALLFQLQQSFGICPALVLKEIFQKTYHFLMLSVKRKMSNSSL